MLEAHRRGGCWRRRSRSERSRPEGESVAASGRVVGMEGRSGFSASGGSAGSPRRRPRPPRAPSSGAWHRAPPHREPCASSPEGSGTLFRRQADDSCDAQPSRHLQVDQFPTSSSEMRCAKHNMHSGMAARLLRSFHERRIHVDGRRLLIIAHVYPPIDNVTNGVRRARRGPRVRLCRRAMDWLVVFSERKAAHEQQGRRPTTW